MFKFSKFHRKTNTSESLFITVKDPQACNCVYERLQQENLRNFKNTLFWRASAGDASLTNFGISRDFFLLLSKNETAVIFFVLKITHKDMYIDTRIFFFFFFFCGNGHFWKKYQAIRIYPKFTFALVFFIQSGNMLDQSLESYTPLLTFSDFWENKNKTNFMLRFRSAKQHKGQLTRSVFDIDKESST